MKKILLSLIALAGLFTANAADVVFDFTNPTQLTPSVTPEATASSPSDGGQNGVVLTTEAKPAFEFTNSGVSLLLDQKTASNPAKIWTNSAAKGFSKELRFYSNSTMTITAPAGKHVAKVVLAGKKTTFTTNADAYDAKTKTWTGSASAVTFTATATINLETVTITLGEGEVTPTPTPTPTPTETALFEAAMTTAESFALFTVENTVLPTELTDVWTQSSSYGAKASAYKGACLAADATLTSPEISIAGYKDIVLSFDQAANKYGAAGFNGKLLVSVDGAPFAEVAMPNTPAGNSWTFASSGDIAIAKGKTLKFAFRYTSTTEAAGTWEIKNIKVTGAADESAKVVLAPTFTPNGGSFIEGVDTPVNVAIACATEGATITYSIDGGAVQTYSAPFDVTATCTIVAQAEKDGVKSSATEANFVIIKPVTYANLAAALAAPKDEVGILACPLRVAYQNGSKLYVYDGTTYALVFGKQENAYNNGDVIHAGATVKVNDFFGVKQLNPVAGFEPGTAGPVLSPSIVAPNAITAESPAHEYVEVQGVTVTPDPNDTKGKNFILADAKGNQVIGRNDFGLIMPTDLTGKFDVAGFIGFFKGVPQVNFSNIVAAGAGVEAVETAETTVVAGFETIEVKAAEACRVQVYNAAGQVVADKVVAEGAATIAAPRGFYIVKAGEKVAKVLVK